MKKKTFFDKKPVRIMLLVLGVALMAAAYNLFFVPNRIAPGGFSGVGTVLYYKFGWPVGVVTLVMNVPLYLFAFRRQGVGFIVLSGVATLLFSALVDLAPTYPATEDMLLASVYGGVLLGLGLGMVVRAGASTGGTDMLAQLLAKIFPRVTFGVLLLLIECVVVGLSAIVFGVEAALYAVVALFISSKLVDILQEGVGAAKAFFIISNRADAIADRILNDLRRGVTALSATGMYSRAGQKMLFCVIHRSETTALKTLVREADPAAFVIVSDVREAMGEGFTFSKE